MPKKEALTERGSAGHSVFVDTGGWIALFSARDQFHADADRIFRAVVESKRRLLTTSLVIAEVHRLLLHRAGIRAAKTALEKIEASPLVRIEFPGELHHQSGKRWLEKLQEQPVSYTDAVSFAVMESVGCTEVISYGRRFRLAGFSAATN